MLPISVRENGILCLVVKDQVLFLVYEVDYCTIGEGRVETNNIYSAQANGSFSFSELPVLSCLPQSNRLPT